MQGPSRRTVISTASAAAATALVAPPAIASPTYRRGPVPAPAPTLSLLTDPFLQSPEGNTVRVVWFTEFPGDRHLVVTGSGASQLSADGVAALTKGRKATGGQAVSVYVADSFELARTSEDAGSFLPKDRLPTLEQGIVHRSVWRHEAVVKNIPRGSKKLPYRVLSAQGDAFALSATFELSGALKKNEAAVILLTSDHQAMVDTPANIHFAHQTVEAELGPISAVFFAGDLVNIPDRASEWFDDARGSAFFPVLQGHAGRVARNGATYSGAPIIQNAPIYPVIGNHEVQGRIDGHTSLNASFGNPVPKHVAESEYAKVAARVNPSGDPAVRARWIEDNSFSTRTYEEVFSLPGNEKYYASTVGSVRLISLFVTRIWRGTNADPNPADRAATSRYQEAQAVLSEPLQRGYGEFIFEDIAVDSAQYCWLADELRSKETRGARYVVVMLHEGPHGLGDNMNPQFVHPQEVHERDADGNLIGIRYDYPGSANVVLHDLATLVERHSVDLVYNGHSHLWNRFLASNGKTNYLEASNTGNTYGAFHPLSGRSRPVPPAPWNAEDYPAQGNPGGLDPITPTIAPRRTPDGTAQPFIAANGLVVFQALETATGAVHSWYVDLNDLDKGAVKFDRFSLR